MAGWRTCVRELTNLPNLVTMGRVVLIPFVLFFIDNFNPLRSFIASLLYLVAAAGDFLDGYLARSRGQVSMLGKFLDPLADKLLVTAVLVFMVALRRVPAWVVVVLIGRDLAINGLRSIASAQGLVIAASDGGKIKTALQLVAIMMLLIHFRYPVLGSSIIAHRLPRRRDWICSTSRRSCRCSRACSTCGTSCRRRCNQSRAST